MFENWTPTNWLQLGGLAANVIGGIASRPGTPNTDGINDAARANAGIAGRQQDLAERQYSDQLAIFNEFKPLLQQQIQQSLTAQGKSDARSDQQWDDYLKTWRPAEQRLAQMSLDMADPARYEQEAQRAGADVTTQFDRARSESRRNLQMGGASQDKIATLEAAGRLAEAKVVGGAQSQARRDTENRAMAYLDNSARFGRNMPSTGIATAQLAGQQGGQAVAGVNNLAGAAAQPANSALPFYSAAVGANNATGSLYGAAGQLGMNADIARSNAVLGGLAGAGRLAGSYGWFTSSEKTKHVAGDLDGAAAAEAVSRSGAKRWAYKPGHGDGNTKARFGPMAEALAAVAPEVSDGRTVDSISLIGLHHAAIGNQNDRLKRVERALSLADA